MSATLTEQAHASAQGFDTLPAEDALTILARGQVEAARVVEAAVPSIAAAAQLAADSLSVGGKLIYAAAGSSGLMALADALEIPGTYGIAPDRIRMVLAGGASMLEHLQGGPEDDEAAARADLLREAIGPKDCVIAVTASGSTPYALAAVNTARAAGAKTVGISNNRGAALFGHVDVAICLPTPPEVIAGSTRMGAGTAQKIALNMLSTMMAMQLGHVHDGYMVNVVTDNIKLLERARGMVMAIAGVNADKARAALDLAGGNAKVGVLIASGVPSKEQAEALLARYGGRLRAALTSLRTTEN
ncbi:MAG: N-acetylmuramic acid 6-phosphate etherase [Candidatus Devosia phytovorans]|uniref:N-acetylmuramic acid 6-phosphate etherase n=1 Tax=Candidatus Devosia phytovorans TaxID=3121372 RepID=A0AAJ5VXE9_9HYPH|nr:N-acetylmuramic acid 6-phosphate etherase [Devosia sp.]WEK06524.1 MAG: N-acetylmuramic acid 6-phosphate etherase [Devosia sp.]